MVTAPLWLLILAVLALLVRMKIGRPIFFLQPRPGCNGRIFKIAKFRTMTDSRNRAGQLLSDAKRMTPFGRWLRSTSLDELPELWNVVSGEMSLVGPRPLLVEYLPRYTARQALRHNVRPGITGLAQVMGRNTLSWEEKFELDVKYVETRTFWLDLRILLWTLKTVVFREGISARGEATMPEFKPPGDSLPHD